VPASPWLELNCWAWSPSLLSARWLRRANNGRSHRMIDSRPPYASAVDCPWEWPPPLQASQEEAQGSRDDPKVDLPVSRPAPAAPASGPSSSATLPSAPRCPAARRPRPATSPDTTAIEDRSQVVWQPGHHLVELSPAPQLLPSVAPDKPGLSLNCPWIVPLWSPRLLGSLHPPRP
jgi:hypothetical protein